MSRPAAKAPVRLAREERVGHILSAARDVFCKKGYEQTAVSEIAARCGVVEGTVFKYFPTKRELLLKVLEHWYEEMFGDYARDLAEVAGTRERLRLLVWRHLRSIRDYPLLCRLMFREVRSEHDYHGSDLHGLNRRYTQLLVDTLDDGVQAGEIRHDIALPLLRDMVYGSIEHYTWNYICGRGALDIDATAGQITALLWDGISSRGADVQLQRETRRLVQIASRLEKALPKVQRAKS
ncbi:MAG: TetR/AcrR family transcriptional regulator [Nevskiaceae bacterium]|nr:MAG: TetR/AcrR family transcriptional regulator [Nevskiaceae bacterium]